MQSKREPAERSDSRAQELHNAHEAAAYNEWLAAEIQDAIADPAQAVRTMKSWHE